MARKAVGKLLMAAVLAGLVLVGPGVADAGVAVKTGIYKGKTTSRRSPTRSGRSSSRSRRGRPSSPPSRASRGRTACRLPFSPWVGRPPARSWAGPELHLHPHLLRQQIRQDPRPLREPDGGAGLRDLPLPRPGPVLSRAGAGQLHRAPQVEGTARHKRAAHARPHQATIVSAPGSTEKSSSVYSPM